MEQCPVARKRQTSAERPRPSFTCDLCPESAPGRWKGQTPMPPGSWRRFAGQLFCADCFKARYRLRAVTLPVMGVLEGGSVEEFSAAILRTFRTVTSVVRWARLELLRNDVAAPPEMTPAEFHAAAPDVYLYGRYNEAGQPCGALPGMTQNVLLDFARDGYFRHRTQALYTGTGSLPTQQFPAPIPVHNQGWSGHVGWGAYTTQHREGNAGATRRVPTVRILLPGDEGSVPWVLRLAHGKDFARQLRDFDLIARGLVKTGQLDLCTQRCGNNRRNGLVIHFRRRSNGERIPCRLMVKMVGYFPRGEAPGPGRMDLMTHPDSFLVAVLDGREVRPWIINADHVRGRFCALRRVAGHPSEPMRDEIDSLRWWAARYDSWRQRHDEDMKHEKRWPRSARQASADACRRRADKQADRVLTWLSQAVAQVVGFCRRRIGHVEYYDHDRAFLPHFCWHVLLCRLRQQLAAAEITFTHHGNRTDDVNPPPNPESED